MLKRIPVIALLAVQLLMPLPGLAPGVARADDTIDTATPPVVTVHSSGGTITLTASDESSVRITRTAAQAVRMSRFDPRQLGDTRIMLPERFVRRRFGRGFRTYRLPARQFSIPMGRFGSEGVDVENPGGDMSISIPKRVGAIFVNAESGNVSIAKLHAPFIISATGGDVRMLNVGGRGLIRTTSGSVTLGGVGGDIRVQTASGAITVYGSYANSVDAQSDSGPIYWRFARCGNGTYRFHSNQGLLHLAFRPEAAAQVDAQSDTGAVQNLFAAAGASGSAIVRVASQHALSLAVNGGGPEITATTASGDISIEPVAAPAPSP